MKKPAPPAGFFVFNLDEWRTRQRADVGEGVPFPSPFRLVLQRSPTVRDAHQSTTQFLERPTCGTRSAGRLGRLRSHTLSPTPL